MRKIILLFASLLIAFTAIADEKISISSPTSLPEINGKANPGVAGAFIGTLAPRVVVAGGSNFSEGFPWEGGKKQYTDAIYLVSQNDGGYSVELSEVKLPRDIAHGVSAVVDGVLYCFGGENANEKFTDYFTLTLSGGKPQVALGDKMPEGFAPVAASTQGKMIYIHGVKTEGNALYGFDTQSKLWSELAPLPEGRRNQGAVFVAQHNGQSMAHYLIGGRDVQGADIDLPTTLWQYTAHDNQWTSKGDIEVDGAKKVLAYPSAVAYGSGHIVVIGGDNCDMFTRLYGLAVDIAECEDVHKKDSLQALQKQLQTTHAGFSREILSYHTITGQWVGEIQSPEPLPVVTTAVVLGGDIIIPSGEVSPGVRTADITQVIIESTASFGAINYGVIGLYLLAMVGIGVYFSNKGKRFAKNGKGTEQFFKGGGNIPWWAAGISIFATALSAITFLSIPAKSFSTDWSMLVFNFTIILAVPIVIHFYLPFFRKLSVASAYEFLEQRFSRSIRYMASAFFITFMFARVAIVLFLPSLALNAVTGMDIYLCIVLMGVVTIAYCTMGGIEAVVWGDVIQGFVLVGGAFVALGYMIWGVDGGLTTVIDTVVSDNKINMFNFEFDWSKPLFWTVLIGGLANTLLTYTSDQSVIQRYISVKDSSSARKGIWLNGIVSIPVSVLFFAIGTAMFVYFKHTPQELNISMSNTDSIFPHFIMTRMPAGLAGLLIAAVFAAAMSTLSSNINSASTVVVEDFYRKFKKDTTDAQRMRFARVSGLIIGSLGVGMAIMLATFNIASLWDQFNLFLGLLTSGVGGLFMMGIFTKRIGTRSALCGFVGSMALILWLNSGGEVSFLLYGFVGLAGSFVVGYLMSFVFGRGK